MFLVLYLYLMADNSRKIKALDFALTAVTAKKSHGQRNTNNGQLFGGVEYITNADHVFATITHNNCANRACACFL